MTRYSQPRISNSSALYIGTNPSLFQPASQLHPYRFPRKRAAVRTHSMQFAIDLLLIFRVVYIFVLLSFDIVFGIGWNGCTGLI